MTATYYSNQFHKLNGKFFMIEKALMSVCMTLTKLVLL